MPSLPPTRATKPAAAEPLHKVIHAAPNMKEGSCTFQVSIADDLESKDDYIIVVLDAKSLTKPLLNSVIEPWLASMKSQTLDDKYSLKCVAGLKVWETKLSMGSSKPGEGALAPTSTFVTTNRRVHVTLDPDRVDPLDNEALVMGGTVGPDKPVGLKNVCYRLWCCMD